MTAAFYNSNPAVIHLLLRYGADPNRHAQRGYSRSDGLLFISDQMTPIIFAAWHNNPAVIQALLDAGVKVPDQKNFWYESTLEMACLNNPDPQVAMLLKKNGAKLSRNSDQMNSMITACGGLISKYRIRLAAVYRQWSVSGSIQRSKTTEAWR